MESIFECGVCFKMYNHSEKKPLSLPCGHTFCPDCLRQILRQPSANGAIKCPFDKIAHHISPDNLPVNYAVLTALPMGTTTNSNGANSTTAGQSNPQDRGGIQHCEIHKNKKVKFYCKNDQEMFCSKCVLKHTNAKHDVVPCSYKSKDIFVFIYTNSK